LLRFGLSSRAFNDDSDTDDSDNETDIVDKTKKQTREQMCKKPPPHSFSWPIKLFNRQAGLYCNPHELKYRNHRKTFERTFYSSLNCVERLELMAKLNEHLGCVNSLGWSRNGSYLLSGSDDLRIILWDWHREKALTMAGTKHKKNIFQTKFYGDQNSNVSLKAVSASADGSISLHTFACDGGHTEKQAFTHTRAVHKIAVTDYNEILTASEDGKIFSYDTRTKLVNRLTTVREKHRKIPLFSLSVHPDMKRYAVSGRDQFVRIFDQRNPKTVYARYCPNDLLQRNAAIRYISCCVYSHDGSEIIASYNDEAIYLFEAQNQSLGSYSKKFVGHLNNATIKGESCCVFNQIM